MAATIEQRIRIIATATILTLTTLVPLVQTEPANAVTSCMYFDFAKSTNINSTLTWKWYDSYGRCIYSASWRAGSGTTTDTCESFAGWLPNGWYDSPSGMNNNWNGNEIKGRVWTLQNKNCNDGTPRTELFIHTEETYTNGQSCSSASDDPWCWDSTPANAGAAAGTNDFKSEGCIKVRRQSPEGSWPNAMGDVHTTYHNHGPSGHGAFRADMLYVHN